MFVARLKAFVLSAILFAAPAWCGREFQVNPNENSAPDEIIVKLLPGRSIALLASRHAPGAVIRSIPALNVHLLKMPAGMPPGLASQIAADPDVHFVEPNRIRSINLNPANDPGFSQEWALNTVQAAQAWGLIPDQFLTSNTAGANRLKIAVLDTGADCTHPDFKNGGGSTDSASGGQLFFGSGQNVVTTVISNPTCPWQDDYGHGTHVTGTIVASANNGIGVAGLAYPLQVAMYKVLDNTGNGSDFDVATAIQFAADAGVQVISMSLGALGYSQTLQAAIDYAWQRNVLVVAAAGNGATNQLTFPAGASHAIGVAATDSGNATAGFSNYGDYVEIAAPGVSVYSTMTTYPTPLGGGSYGYLSGTSMATPHVAALGGLVALTTPGIAAASIAQRIEQTAFSSVPNGGWDTHFGYGIINAYNAVNGTIRTATTGALRGQVTDESGLPLTTGSPNFTPISVAVTFNSQTVMTDANSGLFRFPSVPPGTYAFSVSAPGYPPQNQNATVVAGADTMFPVQMGVTYGQFIGTVLDQGVPVPNAIVQALSGSPALIQATTSTDAFGQYTLWVAAGTYSLRASAVSRTGVNATGTVAGGGASTVNLQISRFGQITGHVTNGSGQPLVNAQVAIALGSSNIAGATTDGSGMYTTIGVPAGTYSVTATIPGPQSAIAAGVVVVSDVDTTANITIISAPPATTATFVKSDTTTQGNWRSAYGADGYNVIGDLASNPSYASPAASGQASYIWANSSADIRALQKASNPADRIAGTWYSGSSFIIDSNITDTAPHQVALYCVDWDSTGRRETVDVLDAGGNVLNMQVLSSSFNGGVYLVWNVAGHVKFRLTWNAGFNAVVSGVFFGGPAGSPPGTAAFAKTDSTTQGNWRSAYGADGYNVIGDFASNPSYAAPVASGQSFYTWAASTSDVRALQKATNSADRIAATWYGNSFLIDTNITDQAPHQVALYCLDWDTTTRRETIDVLDSNGTVLNTQSLTTSFNGGVYLVWNVTGHVKFRVTLTGGTNAVLSGLFFGGPAGAPPTATATFVKTDSTTQGNWQTVYGADGYNIIGDLASNPSYAAPVASGQASYTWAGSTADIRALQKASNPADRIAATWYSGTSFVIDTNITDSAPHQVALYCLDWDTTNRRQTIDVLDSNGTVLNTQALTTSFNGGVYLVWNVTGHVKFRLTWNAGYNAVISGIFFR